MSFVSGAVEETDAGCFGALADVARVRAYERALWGALCHVADRSGCVLRGLWMLRVSVDRGGLSVAKVAPFADFVAIGRDLDRL